MASPMPHVGSPELADIALCIGVGRNGKLDGQRQLSLNEFRAYGQIQVRAQQQNDHGRTPYPGINGVYRLDNRIHKTAPLSSRTRSALRCIDCPTYGFLICYSRVLKRYRPANGGLMKGRTRERISTRTSRLMTQAPSRTQRSTPTTIRCRGGLIRREAPCPSAAFARRASSAFRRKCRA